MVRGEMVLMRGVFHRTLYKLLESTTTGECKILIVCVKGNKIHCLLEETTML